METDRKNLALFAGTAAGAGLIVGVIGYFLPMSLFVKAAIIGGAVVYVQRRLFS